MSQLNGESTSRSNNLSRTPPLTGTVHVDTSASMPPPTGQTNLNDIAGVLRRNQACLNCRRRKLKCDAVGLPLMNDSHSLLTILPRSGPIARPAYDPISTCYGLHPRPTLFYAANTMMGILGRHREILKRSSPSRTKIPTMMNPSTPQRSRNARRQERQREGRARRKIQRTQTQKR
ncbi:hypothetical protein BD324DRAFT_233736 [Kockovaella imperatae]|uniref:Zn(2)-C6 fungal-type domain-containing protein n=1 Tax=Kockovaella imperatae TaxID=4999 RepID=A0A1Y1URJ3_9TREE|nr:hypothetical protein BD324DRAFT_233736 [Kockovaella imperatae]ORX39775.1 hypothetical protein BD324DRAFT_233736 [Kockovaella imperatae]